MKNINDKGCRHARIVCPSEGLPGIQDLSSSVGTVIVTNLVPKPDSKGCVTVVKADGGTLNQEKTLSDYRN